MRKKINKKGGRERHRKGDEVRKREKKYMKEKVKRVEWKQGEGEIRRRREKERKCVRNVRFEKTVMKLNV